jgi:phosphoribosylaminoimidazole-succinocarboxamide synthase
MSFNASSQATAVFETHIKHLPLLHRGKVRDVYALDNDKLVIVATDRLSAFDVVMPDPIPGKGKILTEISNYWFALTEPMMQNHCLNIPLEQAIPDASERAPLIGRTVIAKRLKAIPIEAVVRGYLIGSGYKDYQRSGEICGIRLPQGLRLADRLPTPIFTPATKAAVGDHDENISFEAACTLIGQQRAEEIRDKSLALYQLAYEHARSRGIIIADTKFEFGLDEHDQLILMDEILTPDSSRFWQADSYQPGSNPPSFDKQFFRDYLETLDWPKTAPGPQLPSLIIEKTLARYQQARNLILAKDPNDH